MLCYVIHNAVDSILEMKIRRFRLSPRSCSLLKDLPRPEKSHNVNTCQLKRLLQNENDSPMPLIFRVKVAAAQTTQLFHAYLPTCISAYVRSGLTRTMGCCSKILLNFDSLTLDNLMFVNRSTSEEPTPLEVSPKLLVSWLNWFNFMCKRFSASFDKSVVLKTRKTGRISVKMNDSNGRATGGLRCNETTLVALNLLHTFQP